MLEFSGLARAALSLFPLSQWDYMCNVVFLGVFKTCSSESSKAAPVLLWVSTETQELLCDLCK